MRLKIVIIFLTAVLITAGCAGFIKGLGKTDAIKVVTFNIRYGTAGDGENSWDNRKEMLMRLIKRENPDVLCLQEALRFQLDYIEANMPGFAEIGVGRDDGDTSGEYSALLYCKDKFRAGLQGTFWLSDTDTVPGSITWGNACTRICTYGEFQFNGSKKHFCVFNTHLDHISAYSRQKSTAKISEKIAAISKGFPVILTGDFNAGELSTEILFLQGKSELVFEDSLKLKNQICILRDTYRIMHPDDMEVGTYNGFSIAPEKDKIDYIFISSSWETLDVEIIRYSENGRYPSDHFPVSAELKLKD